MNNLSTIRKHLDEIDLQIVELLHKRAQLIPEVYAYKSKNNIAEYQPWREVQILEEKKLLAIKFWLSEDIIESIFKLILEESHRIQKKCAQTNFKSKWIFDIKPDIVIKKLNVDIGIFDLFKRIYANYDNFYILESLINDDDYSKHSYCWFWPKHTIKARNNTIWIDDIEIESENPWQYMRDLFPMDLNIQEKWFFGWLVWYNSFESFRYAEPNLPFKENKDFYDFEYWLYLEGVKYNHDTNELVYYSLNGDRSKLLLDNIHSAIDLDPFKATEIWAQTNINIPFKECADYLIQQITSGNIFQAVPSIRFDYNVQGSALSFYEKLRELNPSPFMFFFKSENRQIIGASPELVSSSVWNRVETYPIAGTRSRWITKEEDDSLVSQLLSDKKENAEHLMLVDMSRNDLGKVCKYWTVKVDKLKVIKKTANLNHIVSFISWTLQEDKNMFDAFMTNFPMWTVSWAPRIEAIKLINKLESKPRWPYAWAIWYFSFNWESMMAMIIRSLFITWSTAYTQAWAWIVYDSIPKREEKEVNKKLMTIRSCLWLDANS